MKKTNIRIKNQFIIEENNSYYLSSIKDIQKWKNYEEDNLDSIQGENITEKLNDLMKLHDIYSNVNFFDNDETIKTIQIDDKKGGK
tara:strand:+ start:2509 stop:2766 length:258 start_codon:yes stop_codon:yes gene_type:complete